MDYLWENALCRESFIHEKITNEAQQIKKRATIWFILTTTTKFVSENIYFDLVGGWSTTKVHGNTSNRQPKWCGSGKQSITITFWF